MDDKFLAGCIFWRLVEREREKEKERKREREGKYCWWVRGEFGVSREQEKHVLIFRLYKYKHTHTHT